MLKKNSAGLSVATFPLIPLFVSLSISLMVGCAAPPPSVAPAMMSDLDAAPQLSRFARFELASQASGPGAEQKASGSLSYKTSSASFEVSTPSDQSAGRFHVQAEACRDDPSPDCKRRFVVSGRLSVLNTTLNCYIPVRNDTASGYIGQSLAGICQDRNGRSFSISIFTN